MIYDPRIFNSILIKNGLSSVRLSKLKDIQQKDSNILEYTRL